jgi:hypothetical protein
MFVVSPSIVQTIINFSSILVSSDRLRVAAPSLLIIWFANDRRLVVSVLLLFIFLVLVIVVVVGVPRRRRVENDGDEMTDVSSYINFFISSDMRLVI